MPVKKFTMNIKSYILPVMAFMMLSASLFYQLSGYVNRIKFVMSDKTGYFLGLGPVNESICSITADPSNRLILKACVRDNEGRPVAGAGIIMSSGGMGSFDRRSYETDSSGEVLLSYIPPEPEKINKDNTDTKVELTAALQGTKINSVFSIKVVRNPVVFVHGYQANGAAFENMKEYLGTRLFEGYAINYDSTRGVVSGAEALSEELKKLRSDYLARGIQVRGFDVIAHSMGGLVARYYTSSRLYPGNEDVNKLIFLSVPQRGSHMASLGLSYYDDQGIRDLIPESSFLTSTLPSLPNKGLNPSIQTGSILGQYDEAVTADSAGLDSWNIKTEIYNVGGNNFSVDSLLNGSAMQSQNHQRILDNKKVYDRIVEMLYRQLPYPVKR